MSHLRPPGSPPPPPGGGSSGFGHPAHRPPRRRGAGWLPGLVGGALALVLVAGLALVIGWATKGSPPPEAGGGTQAPSQSTQAPSTSPPVEEPSATSSYPAAPASPSPVYRLAGHPLLADDRAVLNTATCELPTWSDTPEAAERYFRTAAACMNRSWRSVMAQFGLPFAPAEMRFPSGGDKYRTACGVQDVDVSAAYYCDGVMYLPYQGLQTDIYEERPAVHLSLMAHEYGHHVQRLAGIMQESGQRERAAGASSRAGLRMNRRMELQAQCFAGIFFQAHVGRGDITHAMMLEAETDQANRGDWAGERRDHGTPEHYQSWWQRGAERGSPADCNTFAAAARDVS